MRIAALGSLADTTARAQQQGARDGKNALRIGAHVLMQGAFLAPGLYLCGVRGWRLLGASLAGSASFTVLSWLWATANGWELLPLTTAAESARAPANPGVLDAEVLDHV